VKDILPTLERWMGDGLRVATATVVRTERSAPRDPGAALAVSEKGEVAGSVTGGCVEPDVYEQAREVLAGGPARLQTYGIADEEAFEVGLPCGGTVHILIGALDPDLVQPLAGAIRGEEPVALALTLSGDAAGQMRLVRPGDGGEPARLLALGETGIVEADGDEVFVSSFAPRPNMYVFGAFSATASPSATRAPVSSPASVFQTPTSSSSRGRTNSSAARRSTSGPRSACSRTTTSSTCRP
jgi:xanthine dehydrogenase accessory factor